MDNALAYADRYALEAGFRRFSSRLGVPNSRASWFARDVLAGAGNAEWPLYEAVGATYLPPFFRVAPCRLAEVMPRSDAFRGSLSGQGYLYQYAFRFSALAQLLASVWLAPTVSFCNRVMFTEVVTRAVEARHRQMCAGPHETYEVEEYDVGGAPWAYNSALDSFVGRCCSASWPITSVRMQVCSTSSLPAPPRTWGSTTMCFPRTVCLDPRATGPS